MTLDISRRTLMGGAAAGSAVLTSGMLTASAATNAPARPQYLYGPDPADAHLMFNENPFGPSPAAVRALSQASVRGAYYQGKSVMYLMSMIAERHGVDPQQVLITNGSYEVLTATALAYGKEGKILGPDLFWDSTSRYAEVNGYTEIVRAPMADGLQIDLDALKSSVTSDISMVQVVNPNNPTGRLLPPRALRRFCREVSQQTTVLVDEAYMEISENPERNTMMDLIRDGYDVIIGRTFSKIYGMAGLRVGYIIAKPEIIAKVRPFVMSSPNVAGIAAAIASYNDDAFLAYSKSKIMEAKEMIVDATRANGLNPLPSETSFVFVDVGMDAELFRSRLAEKRVLVRGVYGEYTNYSRVSTGHISDVERYVEALPYALEGA